MGLLLSFFIFFLDVPRPFRAFFCFLFSFCFLFFGFLFSFLLIRKIKTKKKIKRKLKIKKKLKKKENGSLALACAPQKEKKFLEINAVLVLVQLCKLFIFKLYKYMFIYLFVNGIFKRFFKEASLANPYKLHSLGWRKRVDAKFSNILNIGLVAVACAVASLQKMKYSVLKDISLTSQSKIINPKGLPIDSTFLQ